MSRLLEYMNENKKVGTFGIAYLDERLRGILKGDLIVLGARSGAGKSTLSNIIATTNARLGVKVALFSLENFKDDNFVEKAYYFYKKEVDDYSLSLRDFASGDFDICREALEKAEKYAEKCYEGINIISRQLNFNIEDLKNGIIDQVKNKGVHLIVLDHLDYVDKYDNDTDYTHINSLMKTIREVQDEYKVAVVAISHLRKTYNSKVTPVIPSIDEFIGSSNKVKEATCVIMFAPDDEENFQMAKESLGKKSTWCCIRKLRMGGIDNKAAKLVFNTKTGDYDKKYALYAVNYSGTKITELERAGMNDF